MKIQDIKSFEDNKITFSGIRLDKKAVAQLSKNNRYSLTEPNQRKIAEAIKNLSEVKGAKNINFLLDTAAKNTYSTSIHLKDMPKNNWRAMLIAAAVSAISITPFVSKQIKEKLAQLTKPQDLKEIEKEILSLRAQLLEKADLEQIKKEAGITAKDFEKNLDYLIISSETTLAHKKYVLERLNYFMSDEYEINPQLTDKKSIVLAEMINDMAINVPGSKVPNIKAVDQKQHGMCAAISIVRKKLAYEDKPNYVDAIISELDSSDKINVYDRSALGSGKKINVAKVPVDFEAAMSKGYRIIDASTMHWMQIAHMTGASNIAFNEYIPFDKLNFDVNADSFYNIKISDEEIAKSQEYFQTLLKAQEQLEHYKAKRIKKDVTNKEAKLNFDNNLELLSKVNNKIREKVVSLIQIEDFNEVNQITNGLLNLEYENSNKKPTSNPFAYIPNEESIVKKERIKNYLLSKSNLKEINDKKIEELFSLIEYNKELSNDIKRVKPASAIRRAQELYDIAAAYRLQIIAGLQEKETLNAFMQTENVPPYEYLIIETIDKLIDKLQKNSGHTELIINQLSATISAYGEVNKENTIEYLNSLKYFLNELLTTNIDNIYEKIALGNRKNVYALGLNNLKLRIENCSRKEVESFAKLLNCKNDRKTIIKNIDALSKKLENGNENDIQEIGKLFGSPIELVINNFKGLIDEINSGENNDALNAFLKANNLEGINDPTAFQQKLIEIQNDINLISSTLAENANSLRIFDNEGDVLYSAIPQEVIIKKLENKRAIVTAKELREMQEHLDKISKDRSNDEFGILRGKLKDKSLNKFSNTEKQMLKDVEESIDQMYSYVQKQLNEVRSDIRPMLEELKRIIGLNNGRYWVTSEGHSGLSSEKQIRILEYMTGRPHYSTENLKDAVDKIKNSPYSGIGASSVSHTQGAWHAQYIADITPVTIKEKDENGNTKEVTKEILFNDNTWGVAERQNTWIDSNGLMRTDYGSNRGGDLGYITNDRYWNGNFVDRLMNEMMLEEAPDTTNNKIYKRIVHNNPLETYKTTQFTDMILDGKSPDAKNIADQIHDLIFVPNTELINHLKTIANNYTEKEIENIINSRKLAGRSWKSTYEALKKRIFPTFDNAIKTEADYNKLADDDYLKVVLEKMAIKKNYQIAGLETDLAEVRNTKDFKRFKAAQKIRAINSLKYAFGKNHIVIKKLADDFGIIQEFEIYEILKKYNIDLSDEEAEAIASEFGMDLDLFDGSVKNTINTLMEDLSINIDKIITNPDANKEIKDYLRKYLETNLYFNKKDINNKKIQHIINFIDREYNPTDDNELVKIYREIQDMTKEEFKTKILSKVKAEDLGMKKITGYEILKQLRRYNENLNTDLMNTVYFDSLVTETKTKNYTIEYKLDKLSRTPKYMPKYDNLETLYTELSYDLQLLTLPKLFNKYKERNLEIYGAFPAYPKVNYLNESILDISYNSTFEKMEEEISTVNVIKNQLLGYKINQELKNIFKKVNPNTVIKPDVQEKINSLLTEFATLNYNSETYIEIFEAIDNILELPENSKGADYIHNINKICKRLDEVEATAPKDFLIKSAEDYSKLVDNRILAFTNSLILNKYQNRSINLLNNIKQALIKGDVDEIEKAKNEFYSLYEKAHILNDPVELLETYIKSQAKDSKLKPYQEAYDTYLRRGLQYAQLADMQDTLMEAISDGVTSGIKDAFNSHTINMIDGTSKLMGSKEMIAKMTNQLLLNEDIETASMFLEKLGLAEEYIEFMAENINVNGIKEVIDEAQQLADNFGKFQQTVNPYFEEASKLVSQTKQTSSIINSLKSLIKTAGEAYGIDKDDCVILLKALDEIKHQYKTNPQGDKELYFNSIMSQAKSSITSSIQSQIELSNSVIKSNANLINFIGSIMLKENSKADKMRTDLIQKYQDMIIAYNNLRNLQETETSDTI